jgi:hypothetical protein
VRIIGTTVVKKKKNLLASLQDWLIEAMSDRDTQLTVENWPDVASFDKATDLLELLREFCGI